MKIEPERLEAIVASFLDFLIQMYGNSSGTPTYSNGLNRGRTTMARIAGRRGRVMRRELLAEDFIDAYRDFEEYLASVIELLQSPALEHLVLGVVEKTERKMRAVFELQKAGMTTDEVFRNEIK